MKKSIKNVMKGLAFTCLGVLASNFSATAQVVGTDVFLKGMYVEVGQNKVGAFGTCANAPAGYHPRGGGMNPLKLGFVSDPGLDGWDVGVPHMMGDYFVPGTPHEGWDIQIGSTWYRAWNSPFGDLCATNFETVGGGGAPFTGANTGYEVIGRNKIAYWSGSIGALSIERKTVLDTIRSFFVMEVTLTNTGTTPINDIYYQRNVDPDNEQQTPPSQGGTGTYNTVNTIQYQPVGLDMRCLVTAWGTVDPVASYLGLGAKDCRATCWVLNTFPPSSPPSNIIAGTYANTALGYSLTSDVGIGLIFDIGTLAPGEMTSVAYAYILKESDLDTAFQLLGASFEIDGQPIGNNDTFVVCRGKELEVNISGGGAYIWGDWTPNIGLDNPSGRNNVITVQNEIITYQIIGTTLICPQSDTLRITIIPVGDTFPISASICAGNVYDFNGQTLYSSGVYYQTHPTALDGCDSVVKLTLTINPLPGISIAVDNTSLCEGDVANFQVLNPTANTNYQWLRNGTPIAGATDRFYIAPSLAGEYRVVGVTDKGCVDTSRRITLTINPAATVNLQALNIANICIGDTIKFSVSETLPGYEYYWEPEKSFRYSSGARHSEVDGIMFEASNVIRVRGVNQYGCMAYDEMVVNAVPCCDVYLPTAFSPNGDGLNDYFTMLLREGQKLVSFQIFDRGGKMVYDNGSKMGWNGKDLDGNEVAQAVYYYRIVYSCTDKKNYEAKGDITVIK